jgi:hypothetical protein
VASSTSGCAARSHGEHRYVFGPQSIPTLGLDAPACPYVGFTLTFNTIGRGVLIAHFDR